MIGITERGDAALNLEWKSWVEKGNPAILITKNPTLLSENLELDMNIIVHCTITGFGGTPIEPNVPKVEEAVDGLMEIANEIGMERVVLRIDPIIPTPKGILTSQKVLNLISSTCGKNFANQLRTRISFLDNYPHVQKRFREAGIKSLPYQFHAPLELRTKIWEDMGKPEICGEPEMECTGCISQKDLDILSINVSSLSLSKQRPVCKCLSLKKELLTMKKRCPNNCLYCYWKD